MIKISIIQKIYKKKKTFLKNKYYNKIHISSRFVCTFEKVEAVFKPLNLKLPGKAFV